MKTLGVDLSANPANTRVLDRLERRDGVVAGAAGERRGTGGGGGCVRHDRDRRPPRVAGPVRRGDRHSSRDEGLAADGDADPADRVPLPYRITDLAAVAAGARRLSASSDLIGVAAMRGARVQHLLVEAGVAVDRSGLTGRVVEAYPAAACGRGAW